MQTLIMLLLSGVDTTMRLIDKYRVAGLKSGERTPADETVYLQERARIMAQPHWQIDPRPS